MPTTLHPRQRARKQRLERLEIRVSREQKERFLKAASRQGRTLTQFTLFNLEEAARRAIEEHRSLKLSQRDRDIFVEALMSPPSPNDSLRQAAERFKKSTTVSS